MKDRFFRLSQFLTWPIAFVYFHSLYRLKISGQETLNSVDRPFIMAANHPTVTASFLFRLIVGPSARHLPLRFMAAKDFKTKWLGALASIGVVGFIYRLFGAFTVVPGEGLEYNLRDAKEILRGGGNVVIYPEGGISEPGTVGVFRSGAVVLARSTGAPLVPISLRLGHRRGLRREMAVAIGLPMVILPDTGNSEAIHMLRERILAMYEKSGS